MSRKPSREAPFVLLLPRPAGVVYFNPNHSRSNYRGRGYGEGKKIGLKDAIEALYVILRYAFTNDIYKDSGPDILHALSKAPRFNRWMGETIRPYVGERVLEIGAGIGNLTRVLVPRVKCYVAADIDQEHMARLATRFQHRHNLHVHRCDLSNAADFADMAESMDTVVCLNVLEHIEDDMQGLRNIHSALRRGGRAIVLVPLLYPVAVAVSCTEPVSTRPWT